MTDFHKEGRIGWKVLSDADLGTADKSHQTHIGLHSNVLTFMFDKMAQGDGAIEVESVLLCDDEFELVPLYIAPITRADGRKMCPKSIKGGKDAPTSLTAAVREITSAGVDTATRWYLLWCALQDGTPVFVLFKAGSETYKVLAAQGLSLAAERAGGVLQAGRAAHSAVSRHVSDVLKRSGFEALRDSLGGFSRSPKLIEMGKKFDRQRVSALQSRIGREGEVLVNRYLQSLEQGGFVREFLWANAKEESGQPFDFWYMDPNGKQIFLDVKTTAAGFGRSVFFSDTEMQFAVDRKQAYRMYRVYCDAGRAALQVCTNMPVLLAGLAIEWETFRSSAAGIRGVDPRSLTFSVQPGAPRLQYEAVCDLSTYLQEDTPLLTSSAAASLS